MANKEVAAPVFEPLNRNSHHITRKSQLGNTSVEATVDFLGAVSIVVTRDEGTVHVFDLPAAEIGVRYDDDVQTDGTTIVVFRDGVQVASFAE